MPLLKASLHLGELVAVLPCGWEVSWQGGNKNSSKYFFWKYFVICCVMKNAHQLLLWLCHQPLMQLR